MKYSLDEYTQEEIEKNGNQMYGGKLHDEICREMELEYGYDEYKINEISVFIWKAIQGEKEKSDAKTETLKEQNKLLIEALGFYANEQNWNSNKYRDGALMFFEELGGEKAREALNKIKEMK